MIAMARSLLTRVVPAFCPVADLVPIVARADLGAGANRLAHVRCAGPDILEACQIGRGEFCANAAA